VVCAARGVRNRRGVSARYDLLLRARLSGGLHVTVVLLRKPVSGTGLRIDREPRLRARRMRRRQHLRGFRRTAELCVHERALDVHRRFPERVRRALNDETRDSAGR
jgi:hypothetical protein